jgi:hypothetical protein
MWGKRYEETSMLRDRLKEMEDIHRSKQADMQARISALEEALHVRNSLSE